MTPWALTPRFLSQLAHDLRSPLNVVAAALTELGRDAPVNPGDDKALMLNLSQRAVGRLTAMTSRLSLASRLASGLEPALTTIDLGAVTKEHVDRFVAGELRKRVELIATWPEQPVRVQADLDLFPALLRELLTNANQHARRKVRVEVKDGAVTIDDDGEGIAADERPLGKTRAVVDARGFCVRA